jgi:hypothetical protein
MTTSCQVSTCGKPSYCRELCRAHYQRMWRTGSPESQGTVTYSRTRNGKEQTVTRQLRSNELGGWARTPIYKVWVSMRRRCSDPSSPVWRWYGGKGVRVCAVWQNDFFAFRDWSLAHGFEPGMQIDRVDTDGIYEPDICGWVTRIQNRRNRRQYLEPELEEAVVMLAAAQRLSVYSFIRKAVEEKVARESAPSVRSAKGGDAR